MALLDLYIDTGRKLLVAGPLNSTTQDFPAQFYADGPLLRIRLLSPTANFPLSDPPYSLIPVAGVALELYVGNSSATYLTQQLTWTPSTDLADPYHEALLSFNTAAIVTALTGKTQITVSMQIRKVDDTGVSTILLQEIVIKKGIVDPATLIVPTGQTPLSLEAASAIFLTREIVGPVTWICESDATKRRDTYVGTDGEFHEDPS